MSDENTMDAELETSDVSIHSESEMQRWIERFGCTREDLVYAVKKIGTSAYRVEAYLKRQRRGSP